jgi:hypothetical protein
VERFGLFEDKKDKFRDARRKKLMKRDCKACRAKRQAELAAATKERREQKRQDWCLPRRLPDGAVFNVVYSAATERWSGSLTTTLQGKEVTLQGQKSGVFALLRSLDVAFRKLTVKATTTDLSPPEAGEE